MSGEKVDPIHQFHLKELVHIDVGGINLSFTNSALFMIVAVVLAGGFLYFTTSSRAVVPGRLQSISELSYEFIANMLRDGAGASGMKFFPLVFSLFMFVLMGNLLGMFPYFFTFASHIIVTFALAMVVIGTIVIYGFWKHGLGFLGVFVPHGVPPVVLPLVVAIEVISFLSRPVSLSVRLFANMLAGHITLKVFAGFVFSRHNGRCWRRRCCTSTSHGRRIDRSGISGGLPAGICFCGTNMHVPQRCAASRQPLRKKSLTQTMRQFKASPTRFKGV